MGEKRTLREFVHAVNTLERDIDVYVDGIDGIALCGGEIGLTEQGRQEFGAVLGMNVEGCCIMGDDKDYEDLEAYEDGKGDGGRLRRVWRFLAGLAGYCSCDNYDRWFSRKDETFEII